MKKGYHSKKALIERARWLRKNQTWPEKRLWARLRRKQVEGQKFRRQHILEPFIVDFYCPACRLVVEVDGPDHAAQRESDADRDAYLEEEYDVRVLRYSDGDVYHDLESVVREIGEVCREAEAGDE